MFFLILNIIIHIVKLFIKKNKMWNRKQKIIQSINLIAEERYLNKKFLMEDSQEKSLIC